MATFCGQNEIAVTVLEDRMIRSNQGSALVLT